MKRDNAMRFCKKRLALIIAACALLAPAACFLVRLGPRHGLVAPGVTYENLTKIEVGMTTNEVLAIMGAPLHSNETPTINGREGAADFYETYTYAEPRNRRGYVESQLAIWVHFENGSVESVYAKLYFWGNDGALLSVGDGERYENPCARADFKFRRLTNDSKK